MDYIGSSRMVYDMEHENFPAKLTGDNGNQSALINLSHIAAFVEISQIGLAPAASGKQPTFYIHADPISYGTEKGKKMTDQIVGQLKKAVAIEFQPSDKRPLPSSSGQSFLKFGKNRFPALMVTGYKDRFVNK